MTTATITKDAIRAADLTKVYGTGDTAVRALDHVDVGFIEGRFTAIMGPSGSGKSTLMHCLAGLDSVSGGRVLLGDTDLTALGDDALTIVRRTRLGFVFQAFNLLPTLDARANINLPLTLGGGAVTRGVLRSWRRRDGGAAAGGAKPTEERDRGRGKPDSIWFDTVVDVLGLGDRLTHRPSELSGGQQQRVALARALVTRPEVLFADEPTGNLDSASGAEVLAFLRSSVRELGRTVVMVTHDPVAAAYADRVVLLADGRIAGEIADPTVDTVVDALRSVGGGR